MSEKRPDTPRTEALEGKRVRLTDTDDEGRIGYVQRVEGDDEIHVWLDGRFLGRGGTGQFQPEAHVCVGVLELEVIDEPPAARRQPIIKAYVVERVSRCTVDVLVYADTVGEAKQKVRKGEGIELAAHYDVRGVASARREPREDNLGSGLTVQTRWLGVPDA